MSTADVALRMVTDDDVGTFYDHHCDTQATQMAGFPTRDRDDHYQHWARIRANPDAITRAVVSGGDVAGNIVSWTHDGQPEIGYWIGREYWGRGIASQALPLFLAGADAGRPLFAHVAAHNGGSIRVLAKCGFKISTEELDDDEVVMVLG